MNSTQCVALGAVIAMTLAGSTCLAQQASLQPAQLPDAPRIQLQMSPAEPDLPALSVLPNTSSSGVLPANAAAEMFTSPAVQRSPRIMDRKFLLFNGLHLGMMLLDTEMTQRCIASHRCQEGNPLMPSSRAGQLAVGSGLVVYTSGLSYWLKKRRSPCWWIAPAGGAGAHSVGVVSGFLHQ